MSLNKLITTAIAVLSCMLFSCSQPTECNQRARYNFNPEWLVTAGDPQGASAVDFDDSQWKSVTLPHAYNEDEAFLKSIKELSNGLAWYRKHFTLPQGSEGKRIFIEFEGARQGAEVYVNGNVMILHEDGVTAFGIDVTDVVNYDSENVIAVRTDSSYSYKERSTGTSYQWNHTSFNPSYGGLYKNTYLYVTDAVYQTLPLYSSLGTTGTYVYATDIDIENASATVTAESEVMNSTGSDTRAAIDMVVEDMDGNTVLAVRGRSQTIPAGSKVVLKASGKADGLHFWSWGYGYLYNVTTKLRIDGQYTDEVTTRTGFRKTEFANGLFTLNDRVLQLKGYAQRSSNEWPAVASDVPAWISDFSNGLMVEGNGNLVRWMHITPWKQDVESCDRVGLIQAMPAGDSEKDLDGRQWEQRLEVMRNAIIYNRNNPSIIFYECGNEMISEEHMAQMKEIRDMYDPNGGRAIGSREMLDSKIAEYGGEMLYLNKSAGKPLWATEYNRDEGIRKYWDKYSYPYHVEGSGRVATSYDRDMESYTIQTIARWFDFYDVRPGSGRRVSAGGVNIGWAEANSHYRGYVNYRCSGEVDGMRIPKDAFLAHMLMWDGWVDVENQSSFIPGHWNYKDGVVKNVYVVSTGESVELLLNGKSLGRGDRQYDFLFTFKDIAWEPGELVAVSYDSDGNEVSRCTQKTVGEPARITLKAMTAPDGFKADGADLALLEFEVVDAQGNRCPLADNEITFTINGPAEWRGGIALGEDNYILSKVLPVECGINRAFVRSTRNAGKITVTASADGLEGASVSLNTEPFEVSGGLSTYISGDHQPSYLDRGETPKGPSFTVKRTDIPVASVTVGNNDTDAWMSYDDDELSEWRNSNNKMEDAWITFNLEREAMISQIDVKYSGYRVQRYPVSILVGDKEVFNGTLSNGLGYTFYRFEPTLGNSVTIRLVAPVIKGDEMSHITELKETDLSLAPEYETKSATGQTFDKRRWEFDFLRGAGIEDTDSRTQLRIIEAEFFEIPEN